MRPHVAFPHLVLLGITSLPSAACTLQPDTDLGSRDQLVRITGYTLAPNRAVDVQCEPVSGYPFPGNGTPPVIIDTVHSSSNPITQEGETVYEFTANVEIPEDCWLGGGSPAWAYVRLVDPSGEVYRQLSYDGTICVVVDFLTGTGPLTAFETCEGQGNYVYPWYTFQAP